MFQYYRELTNILQVRRILNPCGQPTFVFIFVVVLFVSCIIDGRSFGDTPNCLNRKSKISPSWRSIEFYLDLSVTFNGQTGTIAIDGPIIVQIDESTQENPPLMAGAVPSIAWHVVHIFDAFFLPGIAKQSLFNLGIVPINLNLFKGFLIGFWKEMTVNLFCIQMRFWRTLFYKYYERFYSHFLLEKSICNFESFKDPNISNL